MKCPKCVGRGYWSVFKDNAVNGSNELTKKICLECSGTGEKVKVGNIGMEVTKQDLINLVSDIEKQMEANRDKMVDYHERILSLTEMNKTLMNQMRLLMSKVREMN